MALLIWVEWDINPLNHSEYWDQGFKVLMFNGLKVFRTVEPHVKTFRYSYPRYKTAPKGAVFVFV